MNRQLIRSAPVPYQLEQMHAPRESEFVQIGDVLRVFGIVWRHKVLVLLATTLGLAAGRLWHDQIEPKYQSTADVLVLQKRQNPMSEGMARSSYLQDGSSIHVRVLKSPMFAKRVQQRARVRKLPSLRAMDNPVHGIATALSVSPETEDTPDSISSVLKLSFTSTHPDDARILLEEIIAAYDDYLQETSQTVNDDAVRLMTQKAKEVEAHLTTLQDEYQEFRRTARLSTLPDDNRRAEIETRRLGLEVRQAELEEQIQAMQRAAASGAPTKELVAIMSEFMKTGDAPVSETFERELLSLHLQEQRLLENYGSGHPKVRSIREQIRRTREMHGDPLKMLTPQGDDGVTLEIVETFMESLQNELNDVSTSLRALTNLAERVHDTATEQSDFLVRDQQLASEIDRARHFYETLMTQMQGVDFSRDLTGYSTSLLAPASPAVQVEPRTVLVLGVPAFLGMLLGLGLSYVIEFFDKTFRDNEDVCRRLHAVVLGHIPRLGRGRRAAALRGVADGRLSETTLCTFFRPASVEAEAYRSIRTALYFSNGSEPARVVQVTSPNAGDGKSTLSSNLGVSIAQSGQRTLLIDADMRSPRLHQVFGIAAQAGLSSVISGRLGWREAVVSTPIAGLSLLTAGLRPDNPSELLTSPRFKVLLDELRSEYDFVVIDTPPLLSVTDPAVVAPRVDGVLLTIRINKNGRPRAERARELLDMLGARVLGVVINGVDHHADSGRFYGNTGTYDSRDYDYFLEGESESGSKNGESIAVTPHATSRAEVALDHKHDVVRPIETTSRAD